MAGAFVALLRLGIVFAITTQPAISAKEDWRSPESVEGAITTSLSDAKKLYDEGAMFIDVRNPRLFAKNHIPGAHHLDLKNAFEETAVSALAGKDDPIVIYCSGVKCSRSYRASAKAVSWGFMRVHYFREGMVEWRKAGYPMDSSSERKVGSD
jgi:rhodanese-related sulfurtransferase